MILFLKKTFKAIKAFKNFILSIFIKYLDKNRYSINNHYGSSIEISLLYEEYKNQLPYDSLFELTAQIYKNFIINDQEFISPEIESLDKKSTKEFIMISTKLDKPFSPSIIFIAFCKHNKQNIVKIID